MDIFKRPNIRKVPKSAIFLTKIFSSKSSNNTVFNYYYSKSVNFKSKISLSVPAKLNILPTIVHFITQSCILFYWANTFPFWEIHFSLTPNPNIFIPKWNGFGSEKSEFPALE
jgi:hypothetical protein